MVKFISSILSKVAKYESKYVEAYSLILLLYLATSSSGKEFALILISLLQKSESKLLNFAVHLKNQLANLMESKILYQVFDKQTDCI